MGSWEVDRWRGLYARSSSGTLPRWRRWLITSVLTGGLLGISTAAATRFYADLDGGLWLEQAWRSLWVAGLLLQAAGTFWVTVHVRPPQTHDLLRTTPDGLALWVRGAWRSLLREARVILLYICLVRIAMISLLLVEVTAMRGRFLDLIAAFGMAEPLPVPVLIFLLAIGMTVALLLPLTALAFDAMLALLLTYTLRERVFAVSCQIGWLLARLGGMGAALWLHDRVASGEILTSADTWLSLYAVSALVGDHGATFTSLARMSQAWASLGFAPWVALLGGALLMSYGALVELGLRSVQRRQERPD
jgi:hypothetical protein